MHTKLTATRQHYVEIFFPEFHLNWSRNVGRMGRNSFTSVTVTEPIFMKLSVA